MIAQAKKVRLFLKTISQEKALETEKSFLRQW
jgi:hypothetical protein